MAEQKRADYASTRPQADGAWVARVEEGSPAWKVECRRVTMGKTPDKHVYLDYLTLGFIQYEEG